MSEQTYATNQKLLPHEILEIQATKRHWSEVCADYGISRSTFHRLRRPDYQAPNLKERETEFERIAREDKERKAARRAVIAQKRQQLLREISEIQWRPAACG
jgi:hypothetical protein